MKEIGLTSYESAYLNAITPLCGLIAAPVSGVVAHLYNKYQTLLVITLIASAISHTSLLFIPRVIRHPRHPSIVFDCSNSQLKIEHCPDWPGGSCATKPKAPSIGNFSNFSLTKCTYVCPPTVPPNSSWYPLNVCFTSASEVSYCLLHDPRITDKGSRGWFMDKGGKVPFGDALESIQFDSRFDRWPVVSLKNDKECVYQSVAPLILAHKSYELVQCRPFVHNCQIHCKVNLIHRPPRDAPTSTPKQPALCYDITGDPVVTFYAYLAVRSAADLFSFVAYNLLDALSVTLTNNFDSLYGGLRSVVAMVLPLSSLPLVSGLLVDYYSSQAGHPDYAPPFILFDGLILITTVLVIAAPAAPLISGLSGSKLLNNDIGRSTSIDSWEVSSSTSMRNSSRRKLAASTTSLRSTPSLRILNQKRKVPRVNWYILTLAVVPLVIISGIIYAIEAIHLYPFLIDTGSNKTWLGGAFALVFVAFAPLALLGKKLVSGLGRLHLILIGFTFHALHLTGVSFLPPMSRTLLIPLSLMESFTFPIMWIGITSYSHYLIKTTLRPELMTRTVVDPSTSNHLTMQYFLNFIHFGLGKVLGSTLLLIWIKSWESETLTHPAGGINKWYWLSVQEVGFPEVDSDGFRILLRLLALASAAIALPILFFAHVFGEIIRAFVYTATAVKSGMVKIQKCLLKTLTLLCCCSCSCKLAKCRLCRVRRKISHGSSCDTDDSSDEDDAASNVSDGEGDAVALKEKEKTNCKGEESSGKHQRQNAIELRISSSQKNELQISRNNAGQGGKRGEQPGASMNGPTASSLHHHQQQHQVKQAGGHLQHQHEFEKTHQESPVKLSHRQQQLQQQQQQQKHQCKRSPKTLGHQGAGEEDHPRDLSYTRLVDLPPSTSDRGLSWSGGASSPSPPGAASFHLDQSGKSVQESAGVKQRSSGSGISFYPISHSSPGEQGALYVELKPKINGHTVLEPIYEHPSHTSHHHCHHNSLQSHHHQHHAHSARTYHHPRSASGASHSHHVHYHEPLMETSDYALPMKRGERHPTTY